MYHVRADNTTHHTTRCPRLVSSRLTRRRLACSFGLQRCAVTDADKTRPCRCLICFLSLCSCLPGRGHLGRLSPPACLIPALFTFDIYSSFVLSSSLSLIFFHIILVHIILCHPILLLFFFITTLHLSFFPSPTRYLLSSGSRYVLFRHIILFLIHAFPAVPLISAQLTSSIWLMPDSSSPLMAQMLTPYV